MELQNIQNEKIKNSAYHVFQILEKEKKNEYNKYQKNMENLKYNVDILKDYGNIKTKEPEKITRKKIRTFTRKKTRFLRNHSFNNNDEDSSISLKKLMRRHYYIKKIEKKNNNEQEKDNLKGRINRFRSGKISLNNLPTENFKINRFKTGNLVMIEEDETIRKKKNKDKEINKKKYDEISEEKEENDNEQKIDKMKNQKEIFITNFSLNTDNDSNTDNIINRYSEYIRNTERYNKRNSQKKFLPPIKNKSSSSNQTTNLKSNFLSSNTLNDKYSYINQMIEEDNKAYNNKNSIRDDIITYLRTESSGKNSNILKLNEEIVSNMIKRNKRIINNIRKVKNNLEEANIDFETKYKYINWKYGIADMNKYFIDIQSYRKNEEELINKRKSFYDRLDDVIDDIKQRRQMKKMDNIAKQFGIDLKNDDDKNVVIEESDKIFFKNREVKNSLKELYKRQKIEKEKREKIKGILERCKEKFNHIRVKLDEFKLKDKKSKEI
jgi:hypothetical protein